MPRHSDKQKLLSKVDGALVVALKHGIQLTAVGMCTKHTDDTIYRLRQLRSKIVSNRYLFRGSYRKRTSRFHLYLDTNHADCVNDTEFKFHFRVSRETFWELVRLLEAHPSFLRKSSDSRGPLPKEPAKQLLALLKYYGTEGNQSSAVALGSFFGVAPGVICTCRKNALDALVSLEERTHFWPDADERRQIAKRTKDQHSFPNCEGLIDGTLLPLATKPLLHGENYLSRKRFYAIVMLVTCDDQKRTIYHHTGWPGSVHDNRVWRNSSVFKTPEDHFSPKEYPLGDPAFTASAMLIPPCESTSGSTLSNNEGAFNTVLSKPRVKSEHCIGILKGRFPMLRQIRLRLGSKEDMKRITKCVRGAVVLHNFHRNKDKDTEWLEEADADDDGDPELESNTVDNKPDCGRRDELLHHLSELENATVN